MKPQSRITNRKSAIPAAVLALLLASGAITALSCLGRPGPPNRPALSGCVVCHVDVADEIKGSLHEKGGIGCTTCHGHSKAHVQDENNEVKPDRVFPRHEIDPFCTGCHLDSCAHAQTKHLGPPATPRKTCANCHGAHRARIPKP